MSSQAIVDEFAEMVAKLARGESLSRVEQARAARFALHRARASKLGVFSDLADGIGPDLLRLLRDRRAVRLHFACSLVDADCKVLARFEGNTEHLDSAEDLALAAITNGGSGALHAAPND